MAKDSARMAGKLEDYIIVSMSPDVCLTPVGGNMVPVPYPLVHRMDQTQNFSPNVFVNGFGSFMANESFIGNVQGAEAGYGGGLVSGAQSESSLAIDRSATVFINGQPMVRSGDAVWMNQMANPNRDHNALNPGDGDTASHLHNGLNPSDANTASHLHYDQFR